MQIVGGPLLHFEEIARIRIDRIVGFFLAPSAGHRELTQEKGAPTFHPGAGAKVGLEEWRDGRRRAPRDEHI